MVEGEINEEICAICSDIPESDLVLCSTCPKSYCNPCLMRCLRSSDIDDMNSSEDWTCMVCAFEKGDTGTGTQGSDHKEIGLANRSSSGSASTMIDIHDYSTNLILISLSILSC